MDPPPAFGKARTAIFRPTNLRQSPSGKYPDIPTVQHDKFVFAHTKNTAAFEGGLKISKLTMPDNTVTMGKVVRSPITGEISFSDHVGLENFLFVDLLERPEGLIRGGKMQKLESDPYLFKPVPMLTRTWIYSAVIQARAVLSKTDSHDPNASMKFVLNLQAVDAPIATGLPSPLLYYVPGAIGASLTNNFPLVMLMLALIGVLLYISKVSNTWLHYRKSRFYSLPLRLIFLGVVAFFTKFSTFMSSIGYLLMYGAVLGDLFTGDFMYFWHFGMACRYEVISNRSSRIFVCRRIGAYRWEDYFGFRGAVQTPVSGMAKWERQHHLIADIGNVICELRPITKSDWELMKSRCLATKDSVGYLAVDAFELPEAKDSSPAVGAKKAEDIVVEDY